jgi:DNA-directed RNA polymerase specialized sigma24 family protein
VASEGRTEERSSGKTGRVLPAPWRSPASFIAAIAHGETAAMRALYLFYAPLLRDQARQLGIPADERTELVTTVLDDFMLHVQSDAIIPYDVARYLVAAVRNRIRTQHRDRLRARALHERAYSTTASSGQRVVAESHSEFSLRSAQASDDETTGSLATAIAKLAEWSALMLRPEELVLMIGVSRHVPLRDIAKQLGISYAAARVRVHRLRERFRTLVLQHVASLDPKEKREVERFLRRAGICLESRQERGRKG